jgi:hypothetical protein
MGQDDLGAILGAIRGMGEELAKNVANQVKVDLGEQLGRLTADVAVLKNEVHTQGREIGELKRKRSIPPGPPPTQPVATQAPATSAPAQTPIGIPIFGRTIGVKTLVGWGIFLGAMFASAAVVALGG